MPPKRGPAAKRTPNEQLDDVIQYLRVAWLGGPDARSSLVQALDAIRAIQPRANMTGAGSATVQDAIATLQHLPANLPERQREITRVAGQLKALAPIIGEPGGRGAEIGKLNSAIGERRAGRDTPAREPRRVTEVGSMLPTEPLSQLPGFRGKLALPFEEKLHLLTLQDVLQFIPRHHIDYALNVPLDDPIAMHGDIVVRGRLAQIREVFQSPRRVQATLNDGRGNLHITWFSTFIGKQLHEGMEIVVAGKVQRGRFGLQMTNPEWEDASKGRVFGDTLIPVYSLTKGVSQRRMRGLTRTVLDATRPHLVDWLADAKAFIDANVWSYLPPLEGMYEHIHYPHTKDEFERARKRLTFENLFLLQLGLMQQKRRKKQEPGRAIVASDSGVADLTDRLPFTLTGAQQRVVSELLADMANDAPMARLIQGDVGSGKTVVAAIAAKVTADAGIQTAIMAPTELLAEQHATGIARLFEGLPDESRPSVALLTGSTRAAGRREILEQLAAGDIDVLIGTHALIVDDVSFRDLGLVVIDEQHRFGVNQRATLAAKATGIVPHVLSMTATPIPRTLNLVLHGDLDVSIIDERPPGRIPITTYSYVGNEREKAYALTRHEAAQGRQVFVICPLVEESDTIEAKSAIAEAERLQSDVFPDLRVDVLHGKMSSKKKDEVMSRFRDRAFDILVSTSVIEVGIDIPNATVMMIEGAERFGLSQLHQFRGRVGRGGNRSTCLLLSDDASAETNARLKAMVATDDGFILAERDLELRGPGDIIGTRQSGLPELGWLEGGFDTRILDRAREAAERLIADDPAISDDRFPRLKPRLKAFWAHRQEPTMSAS